MTKEVIDLGTFQVVSGLLRISDPCYDKKTWCAGTIPYALTGTWKAQVIKKSKQKKFSDGRSWTDNKNVLIAVHESFDKKSITKKIVRISGGVDAGMAGIFDDKFYQKDYDEDYLMVGQVEYDHRQIAWGRFKEVEMYQSMINAADFSKKNKETQEFYVRQVAFYKELVAGNPDQPSYQTAEKTRDWYEVCCDKSLSNVGAGVINCGVVSSSGYGDGGYTTYAAYNKYGEVVGVKLVF